MSTNKPTTGEKIHYCSFCGKSQHEVKKLVAGPSVFICDECIKLCDEIIQEEVPTEGSAGESSLHTPQGFFDFLNEFVVGQERAKKSLSVAMYQHTSRGDSEHQSPFKNNILVSGPTGCGKTYLIKSLAKVLNIPFAIVTATSYSQTGYVGEDVEDMLSQLLTAANGDLARAKRGIVFIDEIDKIGRVTGANRSLTRDVSGEGVQQTLLAILEGATVNINKKTKARPLANQETIEMETGGVLFVASGAFVGLDQIVLARIRQSAVMAHDDAKEAESDPRKRADQLCEQAIAEDFIEFGFIPEFAGRFSHFVRVRHLSPEDLLRILENSKSSPLTEFEGYFSKFNIDLEFTKEFLGDVAHLAYTLRTGARGLRSILASLLDEIMFEAPRLKHVRKAVFSSARRGSRPTMLSASGVPVMTTREIAFISYAHQDRRHIDEFMKVAAPLMKNNKLALWSDSMIQPGKDWRSELHTAMSSARVAIFFVSTSFLVSEYATKELEYFLGVREAENVTVLWILLEPCIYEGSSLEAFQAVHSIDRPVISLDDNSRLQVWVKSAKVAREALTRHSK